jgi:flavodoxin
MFKKLLVMSGILVSIANAESLLKDKKILTVYYSHSGNTKDIATKIQKEVGGDIFGLVQEKPYPSNYSEVIKVAKADVESDFKPKLKNEIKNVGEYDVIFVGSPIWWGTIAPAVKTFLSENNLTGKTVVPFVSHGGGGKGKSESAIKQFVSNDANILKLESFYGKVSEKEVKEWIKKL